MSLHRPGRMCASCREFPTEALKTDGHGQCAGFDRPAAWNDSFCVLYVRTKYMEERRPLVAKLMQEREAATDESGDNKGKP